MNDPTVRFALLAGLCVSVWASEPWIAVAAGPKDAVTDELGEIRQGPQPIKPSEHGVGRLIADVAFSDIEGGNHRLGDFGQHKALVIALTGTGCPLCQKYAPTLARIEQRFRDRDVAFVFINPNESEKVPSLRQTVETLGLSGCYVRDTQDVMTRALQANTTTEVFVLDAARTLVYRGAVDDQYGFGYALDEPRNPYLIDAIDAVLDGRRPEVAATTSPGCELFFETDAQPLVVPAVTYHNRVSRILQDNCLQCHRDGAAAPFSLETHEDVKDYAAMIKSVVRREVMPPWFASPPHAGLDIRWANDRSLASQDRRDLLAWIDAGAVEGDVADAPLSRNFPEEWAIGEPDWVVEIPQPFAVQATGRMPYKHAQVTTTFSEDRWVQAVEIQPTDRAVVHHVLVFVKDATSGKDKVDEEAGFFAAYVPGNTFQQYPSGFAKKLPAGATLVFQLHYTPNGTATRDQTRLGIVFSEQPPDHMIRNAGIANHRIAIPPGAESHEETASLKVPTDVQLIALMPHMHLRGKAFRYEVAFPDGRRERLLDVPRFDFNWQLEYRLAKPVEIPQGSRIEVTGWFDNSESNPANPDPTIAVRWGPQTEDEMLLGYVEYYLTTEKVASTSTPPASDSVSLKKQEKFLQDAFRRADQDSDGKVTPQEFPNRQLFKRLDSNQDGILTLTEVLSSANQLSRRLAN